ncbi:MAG: sodium:alanine symporter family protein [Anaerococcus sp.]|nr:sodium:alanine symporter family protein [Anaerococcus sp.]
MKNILAINKVISSIVWGWPMIILLLTSGILLFIISKALVLRKIGYIFSNTFLKMFEKDNGKEGDLTPFQAVSTALAATVGTGNIVGVAMAIAVGGPGAIFWLWLSAFFGMSTKFAEVTLAIAYREKNQKTGAYVGGPMYYLKNGLGSKTLGSIFAFFAAISAFGIGNLTQANSIAISLNTSFGLDPKITGAILLILTAGVIMGGIKRIGEFTSKLVPFMALFYILASLAIIITNFDKVLPALASIFQTAFNPSAAFGGVVGASMKIAMKEGISKGLFSNEAGLGSGPIAHATAKTDHPVRQGMWGVFEVIVDTFIICTLTALVILVTGLWDSGLGGAALTTQSFSKGFFAGGYIVSIGLALFAFSTILGWYYYGEKSTEYLFGSKVASYYKFIFIPLVFVGSVGGLEAIWAISDTMNGLMALPNLIGLIFLIPTTIGLSKDFFKDPDRIRKSDQEFAHLLQGKNK